MKAALLKQWMNIEITDVEKPRPAAGEVLLRVSYVGVCGSDVQIFNGKNPIATTPVIPGHEFAGTVVELGPEVDDRFPIGQRVAVRPLVTCGSCVACKRGVPHVCRHLVVIGVNCNGGFAEYVRVPVSNLYSLPDAVPETVLALSEPFSIGYHACLRGGLGPDDRVLVTGAGPIGLYAAIVARELGARDVVVSEPLAARREQVEELGITAINPMTEGWLGFLNERSDGEGYDQIIETSGLDAGFANAVQAAAIRGRIVTLGFPPDNLVSYNVTQGIVKELSLIGSRVCPHDEFHETLKLLGELYKSGRINFDKIIAAIRPLEQVPQSIIDTAEGRLKGKILIKVE